MTPYIAARIKRARVERGKICPAWRGRCARDLWPTDGIRDRRRHWRAARAQTYFVVRVEEVAAIPSPGLSVETVDLSHRDAVCSGDHGTIVTRLDDVGRTSAIGLRLRLKVGQCAGRTTDVLTRL